MTGDIVHLCSWIDDHEEEMIDFLSEYVRYRSVTEHEQAVHREFILPYFRDEMGWDTVDIVDVSPDGDRPNVNARLAGTGDGRNLLFNGHSDVVPVTETEAEEYWTTDPWEPTLKDGRLYARGACDMKGPNTAMIWAIKAVIATDTTLAGDLLMSLVVGEERAQQNYGSIPATNAWLEQGFDIPFCINGEPTNNEIHVKSAALFNLDIKIHGKAVHASQNNLIRYPQRRGIPQGEDVGVDANNLLRTVLDRLYDLQERWNREYTDDIWGSGGHPSPTDQQGTGAITLVPTVIDSGSYVASIANHAHIRGQVYIPPSVDPSRIQTDLRQVLDSVGMTNEWVREHPIEVTFGNQLDEDREFSYWPAFEVSPEHVGCDALRAAVETVTDEQPVYSGFKAVTDGGFIQNVCGVDPVSFGPGNTHMGVHGADEYVPLAQLRQAAKIYAAMAVEWCQ